MGHGDFPVQRFDREWAARTRNATHAEGVDLYAKVGSCTSVFGVACRSAIAELKIRYDFVRNLSLDSKVNAGTKKTDSQAHGDMVVRFLPGVGHRKIAVVGG